MSDNYIKRFQAFAISLGFEIADEEGEFGPDTKAAWNVFCFENLRTADAKIPPSELAHGWLTVKLDEFEGEGEEAESTAPDSNPDPVPVENPPAENVENNETVNPTETVQPPEPQPDTPPTTEPIVPIQNT